MGGYGKIDHCRRLNPSLSHVNFSEIASFSVLFSRPTRVTAPCVRHSSDTETSSAAQRLPISLDKEVIDGTALLYIREAIGTF
jgi:hypothetical protein